MRIHTSVLARLMAHMRWREIIIYFLGTGVCLTAPFFNFLNYHGYPITRPEVAVCVLILLSIAAAFGIVCAGHRPLGQTLLCALFLAVAVSLSVGGHWLLVLTAMAAALLLRNRSIAFAGIVFFVVLLLQLSQEVVSAGTKADTNVPPLVRSEGAQLPVIVHVLFDEAIGIEGMPKDIPAAARAAAWGKAWLIENGFFVYGRAYAEHLHTVNSVPYILGFGTEGDVEKRGLHYTLGANRYMAALKENGYAITVYRNGVADYCQTPLVDACWRPDSYRALARSDLSTHDKAMVLMRAFARLSEVIEFSAGLYDVLLARVEPLAALLPPLHWENGRLPSPLGGMAALDRLIHHAPEARPGEAYFVHVLLPHYPYAFDSSCRVRPQDEWTSRRSFFRSRETRYTAYAGQWRCALRRIGDLVQALEASRPSGDFLVIVHGDHGSRIMPVDPNAENATGLPPQTFRDAYSTLAAVRMPDLPAGYSADAVPVHEIIESLAAGDFRSPPTVENEESPTVFLESRDSNSPAKRFVVRELFEATE